MKARSIAVRIIDDVVQQQISLTSAFSTHLAATIPSNEVSLIKQICFGSLRYYFQLDFIAKQLLQKPLKKKDSDVYHLLLIGLYQLLHMRTAEHAAVKETVNVVIDLKKPWAKGLSNAVLRNCIREKETLLAKAAQVDTANYAHPQWFIDVLKNDWPDHWQTILLANNQQATMTLRVNQRCISRDDYLQQLVSAGFNATAAVHNDAGIVLQEACAVEHLPQFAEGFVSVQDGAAQLAMPLLQLNDQQTVLDACAAPGGKTAHILESGNTFETVLAIDKDKQRCQRITENLKRLKLNAKIECIDANDLAQQIKPNYFDRILLDAPCSATGVIRRHPDIKLLRRESDIPNLAQQQYQLLSSLWPLLKTDGVLLYATCSVLPKENHDVIAKFLAQQNDAEEQVISAKWGRAMPHGRQVLPGEQQMDGFYYCVLRKRAAG